MYSARLVRIYSILVTGGCMFYTIPHPKFMIRYALSVAFKYAVGAAFKLFFFYSNTVVHRLISMLFHISPLPFFCSSHKFELYLVCDAFFKISHWGCIFQRETNVGVRSHSVFQKKRVPYVSIFVSPGWGVVCGRYKRTYVVCRFNRML